jgi:hypothetical protein
MNDYCCDDMKYHTTRDCPHHERIDCPDTVIIWAWGRGEKGYTVGLPIRPGAGGGYIDVRFCPWCGKELR